MAPAAGESVEAKDQGEQPYVPLHDLTKGIPSTIDAELAEAEFAARKGAGGITRVSGGGRGDRELPASAYTTSADRKRNRTMAYMFAAIGMCILISPVYLGRNWENDEEAAKHPDAPSGWGPMLWFNRAKARLTDTKDYYNKPAFPKLPDPDPAWARPYTLVLSLEDLLIHSEWTREHGWRLAKRPGVDYFLRYLSQYYELAIFTTVPWMNADPIIKKLDPFGIVMWPLFREATLYQNGEYIKVSS
jgi:import inner membrane translocase subunit TIM50